MSSDLSRIDAAAQPSDADDKRRRKLLLWLGGSVAFLALFALALVWSSDHIEDDLARTARQTLRADGIDVDGLTFEMDGRSVEVSGEVDSLATAFRIDELLQGQDGIRDADVTGLTFAQASVAEAADAQANVSVTVSDTDPRVVELVGTVPTAQHRDRLVAAAVAAFGADAVVDRIAVEDTSPADGVDASIDSLANSLAALGAPGITRASAILAGADLSVDALVSDDAAKEALESALSSANAETSITVLDVEAGLVRMDFEVDGGLIRLNDTVLTDEQRDVLVQAAADASGVSVDQVAADIEVSGLAEAIPGSDGRVAAVAGLFDDLADPELVRSAVGSLQGEDLRVEAIATSDDAAARISGLVEAAGGFAVVTVEEEEVAPDTAASLNNQFADLNLRLQGVAAFETSSAVLTPAATEILDDAVAALTDFTDPIVTISGHASNTGGADFNLTLSQQRAEAVVAYLVANGIDQSRLTAEGRGINDMLDDPSIADTDPRQQRVEFEAFSQ